MDASHHHDYLNLTFSSFWDGVYSWVQAVSGRVTVVFYWKGGTNPKIRVFIGHDVSSAPEDATVTSSKGMMKDVI